MESEASYFHFRFILKRQGLWNNTKNMFIVYVHQFNTLHPSPAWKGLLGNHCNQPPAWSSQVIVANIPSVALFESVFTKRKKNTYSIYLLLGMSLTRLELLGVTEESFQMFVVGCFYVFGAVSKFLCVWHAMFMQRCTSQFCFVVSGISVVLCLCLARGGH